MTRALRIGTRCRLICGLLAVCLTSSQAMHNPQAQPQGSDLPTTMGKIVQARDQVRGYVLDIKEKYRDDPQAPQLKEAKKKYRTALGAYNGWVAAVKMAIRDGKAKDIQNNPSYRKLGDDAGRAARDFVAYVEAISGESKSVLAVLGGLVDVGLKIWNDIKTRQAKERALRAEEFEKDARWSQWEDIKAAPTGAAPSTSSAERGKALVTVRQTMLRQSY